MKKIPRSQDISIQSLILLIIMTTFSTLVFAQGSDEDIPKNARVNTYGSGWECERGYQAAGGACVVIKVPSHAYLTNSSYGNGWKCNWGYLKTDETCTVIKIPANAYLNSYGNHWKCNRGYQLDNDTCVAVKVPVNGFYMESTYGTGWECKRGYRVHNDGCVDLEVPMNAHIDYSGHGWECNPPYIKRQGKCELPRLTH
ncbi:MAG: hypothetical protein ACQ9ET_03055 [Nitrosomonadaceae bacterium]